VMGFGGAFGPLLRLSFGFCAAGAVFVIGVVPSL